MNLLTIEEEKRFRNLLIAMCGDGEKDCLSPFSEISNKDNCILISLANGLMYIKLKKGYLPRARSISVSYDYWELYLNDGLFYDTKINKHDDGIWWSIVREEIIRLEIKVKEYNENIQDSESKDMSCQNLNRLKELKRANAYMDGWRWWKFWWNWYGRE